MDFNERTISCERLRAKKVKLTIRGRWLKRGSVAALLGAVFITSISPFVFEVPTSVVLISRILAIFVMVSVITVLLEFVEKGFPRHISIVIGISLTSFAFVLFGENPVTALIGFLATVLGIFGHFGNEVRNQIKEIDGQLKLN